MNPSFNKLINSQKLMVLPGEYFSPSEYFQNLIEQLKNDIYPLFRTDGAAPFTISRNVFCFIDHVSQLISFDTNGQNERLKLVIHELGSIDEDLRDKYIKYSDYLIQVLRHDIVHNVRPFPKKVKQENGGYIDAWYTIYTICDGMPFENNLIKMKDIKNRKGRRHLEINRQNAVDIDSYSLFFDFIVYLQQLKTLADEDNNFRQTITENYYKIFQKNHIEIGI